MPRYSDTSVAVDAACPSTAPLEVWTICPTVHFGGRQAEAATSGVVRAMMRSRYLIARWMYEVVLIKERC
jgi:hypothetical protein